jgi:hypothetical protein
MGAAYSFWIASSTPTTAAMSIVINKATNRDQFEHLAAWFTLCLRVRGWGTGISEIKFDASDLADTLAMLREDIRTFSLACYL